MQNWLKGAVIALVSVAVTLAVSQMIREPVEGQAPDIKVLRTADGKPNLNGIWQAVGTAHWNLQDIRPERVRCSSSVPSWRFPRV